MKKANLTLITNNVPHEERIQRRIDAFAADIMASDGEMAHIEDILIAVHDYLIEYDDPNIENAAVKIKESIFYVTEFMID